MISEVIYIKGAAAKHSIEISGTGKTINLVKCWPHNHKDLSSTFSAHIKSHGVFV